MNNILLLKLCLVFPWAIYLAISDCRRRELPNVVVFGGGLVMLAISLGGGVEYCLASLVTATLSALFLLLPFFLRAAGAGDVKMLFVAGLFAGPGNTLNLILLVSFAGLILAMIMLLLKKVDPARLKHCLRSLFDFRYDRVAGKKNLPPPDQEKCRVPFGVAIASGLILNLLIQVVFSAAGYPV